MNRIVLENLRSAYNVGNIVRTADALSRGVIWVGYTARADHKQVRKTSLGAEDTISKMEFQTIADFVDYAKGNNTPIIVSELTEKSVSLTGFALSSVFVRQDKSVGTDQDLFVVVWNEITGVEQETIESADIVVHIDMLGLKESLNVGQAAAIMMWELGKLAQ